MRLDLHLLYPIVFISGVLGSQIHIDEKEEYRTEQQKIRHLIKDRKTYRRQW